MGFYWQSFKWIVQKDESAFKPRRKPANLLYRDKMVHSFIFIPLLLRRNLSCKLHKRLLSVNSAEPSCILKFIPYLSLWAWATSLSSVIILCVMVLECSDVCFVPLSNLTDWFFLSWLLYSAHVSGVFALTWWLHFIITPGLHLILYWNPITLFPFVLHK